MYQLSEDYLDWSSASNQCRKKGGHLTYIKTPLEYEFLYSKIAEWFTIGTSNVLINLRIQGLGMNHFPAF